MSYLINTFEWIDGFFIRYLSRCCQAPSCPVAVRRVNMSSAVIVIQQRSKNGPRSDVDLTI